MTSALRRLPLYLLAFLPVVWGNCPYWFVGAPGSGKAASREAEPRCPCCRKKADSAPRDSTSPYDCGDCPMLVARHGSMPAPASVDLPAADEGSAFLLAALLPCAAFDAPLEVACARAAAGPPMGPPGTIVSPLLDEVSLRI